jgi:DNA-binding XRE family transcriptional regulator
MSKGVKLSTFGNELMMLYHRANLSQGEFANLVGVSSVALRKWESGESCPKAESLKRVIEVLIYKGAFRQGEEQTEARYLWQLAMQRGLKTPFDEVWSALTGTLPGADPVLGTDPVSYADPMLGADPSPTSPNGLTLAPTKTRGRRKRLLAMLIALVMLLIIGSAGTLFFFAGGHATDQAYPGYLSGHGKLAFFDPLNQKRGSQWDTSSNDDEGTLCQFTGGAYHVRTPLGGGYFPECYPKGIFSNFALEVQLTVTQGDCGGVIFRADDVGHFYSLLFCQDGTYQVLTFFDNVSHVAGLDSDKSSAVHTGLGQQNKIAVVANGSTLIVYANEHQISYVQDSSYTSGSIALIAYPFYGHVTDVAYRNARLWTL